MEFGDYIQLGLVLVSLLLAAFKTRQAGSRLSAIEILTQAIEYTHASAKAKVNSRTPLSSSGIGGLREREYSPEQAIDLMTALTKDQVAARSSHRPDVEDQIELALKKIRRLQQLPKE